MVRMTNAVNYTVFLRAPVLGLLVLAVLAAGTSYGRSPAKVIVGDVREADIRTSVTLVGTAKPHKEAVLASQVEGWVEAVFFLAGDRVEKGDRLAQLEDRSLLIQLDGAKASLKEAETRKKQAETDLKRLEALYSSRSVAEKQIDDARYELDARSKHVLALKSEVNQLEDQLAKKRIRAPFSGWIAEKHLEQGEWVAKGGDVAKLLDLSVIHIRAEVPERFLPLLNVGDDAKLTFDALPGRDFKGKIRAVFPSGNTQTRTFPVEMILANEEGVIRAGMLCRVSMGIGNARKALLVPKDALVLEGDRRTVFKINDNKAHRVEVEVVGFQDGSAEIRADIEDGDRVVVFGNESLQDGEPVEILPPASGTDVPLKEKTP